MSSNIALRRNNFCAGGGDVNLNSQCKPFVGQDAMATTTVVFTAGASAVERVALAAEDKRNHCQLSKNGQQIDKIQSITATDNTTSRTTPDETS